MNKNDIKPKILIKSKMSTSDEDTSVCTPPEIRKEASNVQCDQLLPQKSKEFYLKVYAQFKDWCKIKKVAKVSENVLLVYMEEKAKNKKASSLWATFSMLKQTLKLKENVDISKYYKVIAFLKRKNDSYTPKKAAVFEKHQITKFILEAPDEIFLSSKVILLIDNEILKNAKLHLLPGYSHYRNCRSLSDR